jgi:raffinose/stachyose/melibiose transport system permease protein
LVKRGAAETNSPPTRIFSSPWAFVLPGLAVYAFFVVWPAIRSVAISFTDWDGISPDPKFIGLDNYVQLLRDPVVAQAFRNNIIWTVVIIIVPVILGLALAVLLDRGTRAAPVLRTLFYMPAVLPLVSVAAIWTWMYNPTEGSINAILQAVGLGSLAQGWLGQDNTAFWAILVAGIWVRTGFPMLIYLAALQGIPRELYEAAVSDGANPWQQFRHVTLPGLRSANIVVIALSLIESFKVFDLVFVMTNGGPGNATQVLGTWMFSNVFQYFKAGYGTAIAVAITVIALVVGIPYALRSNRETE